MKNPIKFPLDQFYDGNSRRNPVKGHLFETGSEIALCGLHKEKLEAAIIEDTFYSKEELPIHYTVRQCRKCRNRV